MFQTGGKKHHLVMGLNINLYLRDVYEKHVSGAEPIQAYPKKKLVQQW